MNPRMSRQERRALQREMQRQEKKRARQDFRRKEQERKEKELKQYLDASTLNKSLEHASSVLKGSEKIANYLAPIVMKLYGKNHIIQPEEKTDYYEVDENYTGDINELFRYIKFFKLTDDSPVQSYKDLIEEDPHASVKQYAEFKKKWADKSYNTNTKNLNLTQAEDLAFIMNTSAAWHIASRSAYDSNQVQERWQTLYDSVQKAYNSGDQTIFDKVLAMIENEKSLNSIINKVDDMIYNLLKKG